MNDGGVQRLIEVRAGHGNVILESPRHRPPNLMNHAESGVAVAHRIGDDADGQQIVDLLQRPFLALNFLMNRVEPLDAAFERPR